MLEGLSLRSRFDDHLSRKFFHMASGTLIALLFIYVFDRKTAMILTLSASLLAILLDLARLRFAPLNRVVLNVYGPLMRQEEENSPSAQLFYALGLSWAIVCLPRAIAIQAILTLAWMDPAAGLIGVRYGRRTWNSIFSKLFVNFKSIPKSLGAKTVEGSLAGFVAAFIAGIIAWTGPWASVDQGTGALWWPHPQQILLVSICGGITGMIAEAWPSQWDDNSNIPFWTGLMVWAAATLLDMPTRFW